MVNKLQYMFMLNCNKLQIILSKLQYMLHENTRKYRERQNIEFNTGQHGKTPFVVSKIAAELEKSETFWENIDLEKFQPYGEICQNSEPQIIYILYSKRIISQFLIINQKILFYNSNSKI